jgi:hypothetical protein
MSNSNPFNYGSKVCFNAYVISPTSLWALSFPPLKFDGTPFFVLIPNGPTPFVFPLFSSSYEVFDSGMRIKGSY